MSTKDARSSLRRRLARTFLDVLILQMVTEEPLWGYRLISTIRRRYDLNVGPPTIYPLLASMEAAGFVESEEVYEGRRRRKVYHTTPKGLERIECFKAVLLEMAGEGKRS